MADTLKLDILNMLINEKEKYINFFNIFDKHIYKEINLLVEKINEEYNDQKKISIEFKNDKDLNVLLSESNKIIDQCKNIILDKIDQFILENILNIEKKFLDKDLDKESFDFDTILIEIRPGIGGQEAAIFAFDLLKMYEKFAEINNIKFSIIDITYLSNNSIRDAIISCKKRNIYGLLYFESGVHRVQRVPQTENLGRIHTSTTSVIILPETKNIDTSIDPKDLRIDTYRSSGKGGQHVNKTDSAVRITHIPTGIVVQQQDEKSQHANKQKALRILNFRINQFHKSQIQEKIILNRKTQVTNSARSEKIRTYNMKFRVTDHRINFSIHDVMGFMEGQYLYKIHRYLRLQFLLDLLLNSKQNSDLLE